MSEEKEEANKMFKRTIAADHAKNHLFEGIQEGRQEAQQERLKQGILPKHMTVQDPENLIHEELEEDEKYDEEDIYEMFCDGDEEENYEDVVSEDLEQQSDVHDYDGQANRRLY